jgi:glycosyltransferase involved in cell wall biosynthesis
MSSRTSRTRVLFVEANDDSTVGGSHHSMFDLVRLLDRTRFEPIVCFYRDNAFVARLRALGVSVEVVADARRRELDVRLRGGRPQILFDSLRGVWWRYRMLRRLKVGLVHINNSPLQGADDWWPATRLARVPIVSMIRGDALLEHSRIRFLAQRFERLVAVSRHMAEDAVRAGIQRDRVAVVYNGIDLVAVRAAVRQPRHIVRQQLGVRDDTCLVLMVGNLREWKGQHVVIEALAKLSPEQRNQMRMVFVGEASEHDLPYKAMLESRVRETGLEALVQFLGFREDVAELLAAADIALHASTTPEPFGRVLVEAMAHSVPVIASKLGGPAEIVTEGSGLLFDPEDSGELAQLLGTLVSDPARRAALGAAGRVRAEDFDVAAMVAGVTRAYDSALASRDKR